MWNDWVCDQRANYICEARVESAAALAAAQGHAEDRAAELAERLRAAAQLEVDMVAAEDARARAEEEMQIAAADLTVAQQEAADAVEAR